MQQAEFILLLSQALTESVGIEVETDDKAAFTRRFYSCRKQFPEFAVLSLRASPTAPDTHLWLVNKGDPADEQSAEE